jgi:hypothetical protein
MSAYRKPEIRDYGDLLDLTANDLLSGGLHSLPLAVISTPGSPNSQGEPPIAQLPPGTHPGTDDPGTAGGGNGGGGGGGDTPGPGPGPGPVTPIVHHGTTHSTGDPGGAVAGVVSGAPQHVGGGGSDLPFTGFAVGAVAAIGSAFAASGALIRRAARRH